MSAVKLKTLSKRAVAAIAGGATALVVAVVALVAVILGAPGDPTLYLEGMELRLVADGKGGTSLQGLLEVSVSNLDYATSAAMTLTYNSEYMQISDYETNEPITAAGGSSASVVTRSFFRVDEALYPDESGESGDPFYPAERIYTVGSYEFSEKTAQVFPNSGRVQLQLSVRNDLTREAGKIHLLTWEDRGEDTYSQYYVDAATEKVTLGVISFRIDMDKYVEMAEKYSGKTETDESTEGEGIIASGDLKALLAMVRTEDGDSLTRQWSWSLSHMTEDDQGAGYYQEDFPYLDEDRGVELDHTQNGADYVISLKLGDLIGDLEVPAAADGTVTVNAYQAYTDGTVADIARTLQNYAGTVRATYLSGKQEDLAIYWGGGDGMYLELLDDAGQATTGIVYHFRWDESAPEGYVLEEGTSIDGPFTSVGDDFVYNPKQGQYHVLQYYRYENQNAGGETVSVVHPIPVEVILKVVPVKTVGATADRLSQTYRNLEGQVPLTYPELDLSDAAKLALDTVLAGVTPTVPITWTPGTIETVIKEGDPSVTWPVEPEQVGDERYLGRYLFHTTVSRATVEALYPWLTVTDDYPLEAVRRIVDMDDPILADLYEVTAQLDDPTGTLYLYITRRQPQKDSQGDYMVDQDGSYVYEYVDMATGYDFKAYLPDGTYVQPEWFTALDHASYAVSRGYYAAAADESVYTYRIAIVPGDNNSQLPDGRELTRRSINLGGYFGVEIAPPDGGGDWTDRIPVYSRARTNIYLKSYVLEPGTGATATEDTLFDYTGSRAGLMPFYTNSVLPDLVTLATGDQVETRYDPATGAEPGYTRQFKIQGDQWQQVSSTSGGTAPIWSVGTVVTYGRDPFADVYTYSSYGTVHNNDLDDTTSPKEGAVVRVQVREGSEPTVPETAIRLTYEETGDSVTLYPEGHDLAGQVQRVTFDTRQVGYTYQQVVKLTLTNTGDTDIRGLYVDVGKGYFTVLSGPAAELAPGASCTFELSYMPGLAVGDYLDTLGVYAAGSAAPLRTFEAALRVSAERLHRVTVVVEPSDLVMGDAWLVNGVTTNEIAQTTTIDKNLATSTYVTDDVVWVLAGWNDEYELLTDDEGNKQVYYLDENGSRVYLTEYVPDGSETGALAEQENLFFFAMPARDVTVYVEYYEPLSSKLRLEDLRAYANETADQVRTDGPEPFYGTAAEGYPVILFDPARREYLVILEEQGDDVCAVDLDLRMLETHINGVGDGEGINQDVTPLVEMKLDLAGNNVIYSGTGSTAPHYACDICGRVYTTDPQGAACLTPGCSGTDYSFVNGASTHRSSSFQAPEPGESRTVTITISYDGRTDLLPPERDQEQYVVRFVRKSSTPSHTLMAGNSPYGMIENDASITDKQAAKAAFDASNAYDFDGQANFVPVKAAGLTNTYWPEAWGGGVNYDRDESALFVYKDEAFDIPGASGIRNNAGDLIDGVTVTLSLEEYYLLSTSTDQAGRFDENVLTTNSIELGSAVAGAGEIGMVRTQEQWNQSGGETLAIRPGVYRLTYSFTDYDGTTTLAFTRPLIVLDRNGDVDADGVVTTGDADLIRERFSQTLGMDAPNYGDSALYRYRMVDANNDRNLNNIDANAVRQAAQTVGAVALTEYYLPIDYTSTSAARP